MGYFYKGKLIERSVKVPDIEATGRVFRRASRRVDLVEHALEEESNKLDNELHETAEDMSVENNEDEVLTVGDATNENGL